MTCRMQKVGHRNERRFSFEECLLARLLADLSAFTRVKIFTVERNPLIKDLRGAVQYFTRTQPVPEWVQMWYTGKAFRIVLLENSVTPDYVKIKDEAGRAVPFIAIPFREIYEEVAAFFAKEATK